MSLNFRKSQGHLRLKKFLLVLIKKSVCSSLFKRLCKYRWIAFELESISLWRVTLPVKPKTIFLAEFSICIDDAFCFTGTVTLHKEVLSNLNARAHCIIWWPSYFLASSHFVIDNCLRVKLLSNMNLNVFINMVLIRKTSIMT